MIIILGCNNSEKTTEEYLSYITSIQQWHKHHNENFKKDWLSLAGRFQLQEGENSFGSNESNDIMFPNGDTPEFIGSFFLKNDEVSIKINPDVEVLYQDEKVLEMELINDVSGKPTILQLGSLSWFIIKREDEISVRLRDSKNPNIGKFKGIETYAIDTTWRIIAHFEPHMQTKIIETTTTLGTKDRLFSPGALGFKINNQYYRLDITHVASDNFLTLFADETSGDETYGGGRFLAIEKPGENGITFIDFNKAINPPCVWTEYADCPLPPPQNILPIKITAGEKKYQN